MHRKCILTEASRVAPKNLPQLRTGLPGPLARKILEKDSRYLSPSYTRAYPLVVKSASGMMVEDVDGNRFLDFTAGVAVTNTGHAHPDVVKAIQDQAARFLHMAGTDFYYGVMSDLAERLAQSAPGDFEKIVLFTNSGAETVEAAFKLVRHHTRRPRMIAFTGAFHGRTFGALSLTASKPVQRRHFAPLVPEVTHVPYAYCYRCPFHLEPQTCSIACVKHIEDEVFRRHIPPEEVAAIVVEPIQGEGGYVIPPPAWLPALAQLARKHGIPLIVDEIQTGIGRTGKMFAVEHSEVEPDVLCLAKGLASGLPLGAMISRASLNTWESGAHASTFGGNPIACAAALETLRLVQETMLKNVVTVGAHLLAGMRDLQSRHDSIGDVRGLGLMGAVEFVRDRTTRERAPELRNQVVQECFAQGLLVLGCGDSSLRFSPPLIAGEEDVDCALRIVDAAIKRAHGTG